MKTITSFHQEEERRFFQSRSLLFFRVFQHMIDRLDHIRSLVSSSDSFPLEHPVLSFLDLFFWTSISSSARTQRDTLKTNAALSCFRGTPPHTSRCSGMYNNTHPHTSLSLYPGVWSIPEGGLSPVEFSFLARRLVRTPNERSTAFPAMHARTYTYTREQRESLQMHLHTWKRESSKTRLVSVSTQES